MRTAQPEPLVCHVSQHTSGATGGFDSVKKNTCSFSVPDPGWCGGPPLASIFAEGGNIAGSANGMSFAPDGTIYWTEIALGTVFKRPPGGPSMPLLDIPFGLNSANPLTLSDDGTRLFAAGCYGGSPLNNSFVEIDPVNGGIINTLRSDIEGCASNGMS